MLIWSAWLAVSLGTAVDLSLRGANFAAWKVPEPRPGCRQTGPLEP